MRGTKNADVPAIVALRPDVVVANREENRRVDVERIRAAGVKVEVTDPTSLVEVVECVEHLGRVVGVEEPAFELADAIRSALAEASDAQQPPLRTFCPVWRDPWIAVGTGTIAADLLRRAGFVVVPAEPRYPRVDLDEIAASDPDVVLLPDEPYEFGEADREPFARWRARVHLVDGVALTWWGPRTPAAIAEFRSRAAAPRSDVSRLRARKR